MEYRASAKGGFIWIWIYVDFFMYFIQHCFISRPSDSNVCNVWEDAGIKPRTVIANFALAVGRSNHSAIQ
jgi:hypothetical protein